MILGGLFFILWYASPKTQNLRIYQQDIFQWNTDKIAEKMNNLEFKFEVFRAPTSKPVVNPKQWDLDFVDRPMAYEKDEIKLREYFYYQQAYFYKSQALKQQNISDIIWVENTIDTILQTAASQSESEKENVHSSEQFCLNVYFRPKNSKEGFSRLRSYQADDDDDAIEISKT